MNRSYILAIVLLLTLAVNGAPLLWMSSPKQQTFASLKESAHTYDTVVQVPMGTTTFIQKRAAIGDLHGVIAFDHNEATQLLYIIFDEKVVAPEELKEQVETIARSSA